MSIAPARSQNTNPAATACGLPASGLIWQTVTYTLTSNCELSAPLYIETASTANLTIEGKGFRIRAASDFAQYAGFNGLLKVANATSTVTLNEVTLDANERHMTVAVVAPNLTATKTTFQGLRATSTAQWVEIGTGSSWSLTNVLFRNNVGYFGAGTAFTVKGSGSLTMNNVAFERNRAGRATIEVEGSPTINATGCLSDVANVPRLVFGDSSFRQNRPACAGKVGNNHDLSTPTAVARACGFPSGGEIRTNVTYALRSDCRMSSYLYITENVAVTVNGGGRALIGVGDIIIYIGAGARLTLNNAALVSIRIINWGHIEAERLAVYQQPRRFLYHAGTGNIDKMLLRDISYPAARGENAILVHGGQSRTGTLTITDGIFLNVANARFGTLMAFRPGAAITLQSSATFINNSPANTYLLQADAGAITDPAALPSRAGELSYWLGLFPRRQTPPPRVDDGGDRDGSNTSSSSDGVAQPTAVPVIRYSPAQSCQTLQPDIVVSNASSGTSCSQVEGSGTGHPDVIAANPSLAVDIWGWVTPNTEVCFRASSGSIKFIDTTLLPRTVTDLPAYSQPGGLLCATIDSAGQVALVPGPPAPQQQAASAQGTMLIDCMVLLQYALNFRDAPDGEMIDVLPSQVKLTVLERANGWFKVDYHGEQGWIAAQYVAPEGDCG